MNSSTSLIIILISTPPDLYEIIVLQTKTRRTWRSNKPICTPI